MEITVRAEEPADYAAVADIHIRAFGGRWGESLLVAAHRLRPEFDRELSLVAVVEGAAVGHALFSPREIAIGGQTVPAVNVAPVGVLPEYQGCGVGGALMRFGLRVAAAKGYQASFLLGHASYYPRFGYAGSVFGHSQVLIPSSSLPDTDTAAYVIRPVQPEDVAAVAALREWVEAGVDFAIRPGQRYADWVSCDPGMRSQVYCRDRQLVGYARYKPGDPDRISCFLARDRAAALTMLRTIAGYAAAGPLSVPLHPSSRAAKELLAGLPGEGIIHAPASAMALRLLPGPLDRYLEERRRGTIPPGRITWPVEFELLD